MSIQIAMRLILRNAHGNSAHRIHIMAMIPLVIITKLFITTNGHLAQTIAVIQAKPMVKQATEFLRAKII